ncbi:hypothetical protein PO878_11005 [Iamia majanohamensis]|uniref:Tetratricopeptide repeat protein n=1 Tax=Iamia majanohamensis TaxID=467976 RepID=A0AAE9Y9Q7_9ACTN|nr:hypothetical protein [Iamia majanohamensis]WCO65027.1 hypothetical protein PO878_11005 [Iamia majanohamensis]
MDHTGQVHLLLGAPGQPPPSLPDSAWRMWVLAADGPIDPHVAAGRARLSPVAPRAERALVAAVAADDLDGLLRLSAEGGAAHDAARILTVGRLGAVDRGAAVDLTAAILREVADPSAPKVLRRHFPDLHVLVPLAPSAPALVPVSRVGLGLLLADMHSSSGRPQDAVAVLRALPAHPAVRLALAATLLGNGEHDRVLEITTDIANVDDVSALVLVARSVAARSDGDLTAALDATCAALAAPERSPGVLAAALEERSHLYTVADNEDAARADMEVLGALAAGTGPITIPEAAPVQRTGGAGPGPEQTRDRARERMRRRITGVGEPGTFGGRHHSTYREEIAAMFALGQTDAVEELLLGLLDAVEDEVAELHVPFDPTFFLTLADLYNDSGRTEDLAALRDRYAAAEARAAQLGGTAARTRAPVAAAPAAPAAEVGAVAAAPAPGPFTPHAAPAGAPRTSPAPRPAEDAVLVFAGPAPEPEAAAPEGDGPDGAALRATLLSTPPGAEVPVETTPGPTGAPAVEPLGAAADEAPSAPAPALAEVPAARTPQVEEAEPSSPVAATGAEVVDPISPVSAEAKAPAVADEDVAPADVAPAPPGEGDRTASADHRSPAGVTDVTPDPTAPEALTDPGPVVDGAGDGEVEEATDPGPGAPTAESAVDLSAAGPGAEPAEPALVGAAAPLAGRPQGTDGGEGPARRTSSIAAAAEARPRHAEPAPEVDEPAATDPAGDDGAEGDEDDERARRLRALQRTVRGPRVRSL